MPTYVYRREDGTTFEIEQRITDDALETCPETGQPVERIITGSAGLIFKGDGFYVNDYGSSSNGSTNGTASTGSSDDAGAPSEADSTAKSDSTASSDDA